MTGLRALAMLYACGVVLAAPVTLHADDPQDAAGATETTQTTETAPATETTEPTATAPSAPPPPQPAPPPPPPAPETAPAPAPAPVKPAPKPRATAAAAGSVQMRDYSFSPATITVNVGDSVTWVNAGEEPHNAVGDAFSTSLLDPGESGSKSFASAGTFSYICTVHPQMKGTVKVAAAAQTGGGADDAGTQDETSGPQLAATGLDAWLLALAGVAMLAAGMAIRNRVART